MKKILIVNDLLYGGGTENVLSALTTQLRDNNHRVTVLTYYKQENYEKHQIQGVKYIHLGCPLPTTIQSNSRINKLYFKVNNTLAKCTFYFKNMFRNYDTIIAFKEGYMTRLVSRLSGKQKIAWVHTDFSNFHWSKTSYKSEIDEKICYGMYDSIVTVSMKAKQSFINLIGYKEKVTMIYNPVNFERIQLAANDSCLEVQKPNNKKLFITVGRLSEVKGYHSLLKVIKELNKNYDNYFELWIVGDGELRDVLQNYVYQYQLKNVKLLGHQENPYPYMKQADYFICSSESESFGLSIVESMILNVPVISTKCGIIEEFMTESDLGIILNELDVLYKVVVEILENKQQYVDKEKVIEKCRNNFSIDSFSKQVKELIK